MRIKALSLFGLFAFLIGNAYPSSSSPTPSSHTSLNKSIFRKLTSDHYFKNASCAEFVDYNLAHNGLPKLGALEPVVGTRLSTDRQNEGANPPILTDSVEKSERPYESYRLSTYTTKTDWETVVDRELEIPRSNHHLKTRAIFHFQILNYDNRGSCALSGFDFQASQQGDMKPIKKYMDLNSCLDLFTQDAPGAAQLSEAEIKAARILKDDCSMSMHYSLEAKKILSAVSN